MIHSHPACKLCGAPEARTCLDGEDLCDRCLNFRMSELTGYPMLPAPPPPLYIKGPDGHGHTLSFRLYRGGVGTQVELVERLEGGEVGYRFEVMGNHEADVDELLYHIDAMARREIGLNYLEPARHRSGWTMAEGLMEVAGRFEWDEETGAEGPYQVVVDGRSLSWEEFGRTLESFEGWRFRLRIEDRMEDLRPDAQVVAFPARAELPETLRDDVETTVDVNDPHTETTAAQNGAPHEKRPDMTRARGWRKVGPAVPNVDSVLDEFLVEQAKRLSERTMRNYYAVIDLLKHSLNGYGYQALDDEERALFDEAYDNDDEAFVHLFGPDKIVQNLGEFLGYYMVSKVFAGAEILRAAGTVTKKLSKWLGEKEYIGAVEVAMGVERGADAARELPAAEKLSELLFDLSRGTQIDVESLEEDDWVEDYLTITRVEPGKLWFDDAIGPVKVPKKVSDLAQVGWAVSATLARVEGAWQIVSSGRVYP